MSNSGVTLDYGRRRLRRVPVIKTLLIIALLLMAGAVWYFRREIADRYHMYNLQRQCLTYSAPVDQIAYEQNEKAGDQLVERDPSYKSSRDKRALSSGPSMFEGTYRPIASWEDLCATLSAKAWGSFPHVGPRATVFVHERRSKSGERRLVVTEMLGDALLLHCFVFEPGSTGLAPTLKWEGDPHSQWKGLSFKSRFYRRSNGNGFRCFFGQPDPNDESRFTIRVSIGDLEALFIGTLQSDDTVRFEIPKIAEINKKLQ